MVLNGEATQVQSLDDKHVREILNYNKIDIGKGPASCSGCCGNALDCGNLFKSIKISLRGKNGIGDENSTNSELEDEIDKTILENENTKNITADKRYKIYKGVVQLFYYEMKMLNFSILQKSFEMIGMIGKNKLERTLSCSPMHKNITNTQLQNIKLQYENLKTIFSEKGEIKESDFDMLNILKFEEGGGGGPKTSNIKDELVVYRQRAVILTAEETLKRRDDYLNEKKIEKEEGEKRKKEREEGKGRRKAEKEEKEGKRKRKREAKAVEDQKRVEDEDKEAKRMKTVLSLRGGEGGEKGKGNKKSMGGGGGKKK